MPPARRGRGKQDEEEPEEVETEEVEETEDDEDIEDAVEETGSSLRLNVTDDNIEIDLPRDGNEAKALDALAKFVDALG